MASLVLGAAGSYIGGQIGGTILGMAAAQIGGMIGSSVGSVIDSAIMSSLTSTSTQSSIPTLSTSTEGSAITRFAGYARLGGQVIWATKFKEVDGDGGGKGFGGSSSSTTNYSISFAIALAEGVVHKMGRVWCDGNLVDLTNNKYGPPTIRFYQGTETQTADPLIEEIEGTGNTPAYRGICYVVFEDLLLTEFGNRIPQISIELVRSISADKEGALENILAGVNLIPGAGEFVYETDVVSENDGYGTTSQKNANNSTGQSDVLCSLDDLTSISPNLKTVSLVVGWFGTDLRAGNCVVRPGVEEPVRKTSPETWSVAGTSRGDAYVISTVDGRPAYGGTPDDAGVTQTIKNLKARGLRVVFYPFVFMDIASGNTLPNPYSNNAATVGQPVYPWRGRITPSPAPGYTGSVDKTAAVASQVTSFFSNGYTNMVLHYAHLCADAGGVDAFIIGSELRGLTRARSDATTYPAVAALKTLAASVKAIVGSSCKVGYAADWSEYNCHQTGDTAGAAIFNLDPLWSDANIDFIGIDNYMPLADWRDGTGHLDYNATTGPTSIYDLTYLKSNVLGGEDYAWYYASAADRDSQTRTPISDGLGKPWVFRAKDIPNWWSNYHYDRPAGTESGSHTAWVPKSKPIWFTEVGCPAIEKGANQPNVFYDPKSSESAVPYYSTGDRDDMIQRTFLEAFIGFWNDNANNPASTVYSGRMVDTQNINVWCWDARPFPFFPSRSDVWGDTENYEYGHWLNGRLGEVLLADLVSEICEYAGFTSYDVSNLSGLLTGFANTDTISVRDALSPLSVAYFFDGVESQGVLRFVMRGQSVSGTFDETNLCIDTGGDPNFGFTLTRALEDDLPIESRITFYDPANSYQQSSVDSRRLVGKSTRVATSSFPLVLSRDQAQGIGDKLIQDAWIQRESANFALPPSALYLDPADEVQVTLGSRARRHRISQIDDTTQRTITAVGTDPSLYGVFTGPTRNVGTIVLPPSYGQVFLVFMDMPALTDTDFATAWAPHVVAYADPWPGKVLVYKSATTSNYTLDTTVTTPGNIGQTMYDFYAGPVNRWDKVNTLYVALKTGTLSSTDDISVFGGANALAIQNADGYWEIVQFETATLIGDHQWALSMLIRGQLGTEIQMRNPVAAGARVVVLDKNVVQLGLKQSEALKPFNWLWGPQGKDLSDSAYQGAAMQFQAVGSMPPAPCHIDFSWSTTGPHRAQSSDIIAPDLMIWWLRRDRNPQALDILRPVAPMSEESERYVIEIKNGSSVVRTADGVTIPDSDPASQYASGQFRYTKAMQDADFPGGIPNPLVVTVYQMSASVGRGWGRTVQLWIS